MSGAFVATFSTDVHVGADWLESWAKLTVRHRCLDEVAACIRPSVDMITGFDPY